jgi:hypothetical protein
MPGYLRNCQINETGKHLRLSELCWGSECYVVYRQPAVFESAVFVGAAAIQEQIPGGQRRLTPKSGGGA